jgi:hypothetical protein
MRNMLHPAVEATSIPGLPLRPLKTEITFSGRVVAIERMVRPTTVLDRWRVRDKEVANWERTKPEMVVDVRPRRSLMRW